MPPKEKSRLLGR